MTAIGHVTTTQYLVLVQPETEVFTDAVLLKYRADLLGVDWGHTDLTQQLVGNTIATVIGVTARDVYRQRLEKRKHRQ